MGELHEISHFVGHDMVDCVGEKLGRVECVYFDERTTRPPWARVEVYALGNQPTFVPLADSSSEGGDLQIAYEKRMVLEAPIVEAVDAEGRVPFAGRTELYRYYGLGKGLPVEPGGPKTFP